VIEHKLAKISVILACGSP